MITQLKRSLEDKLQTLGSLAHTLEDDIEAEIIQADEIKEWIYAALSRLAHCLSPTLPHGPTHTDSSNVDPPSVEPAVVNLPGRDLLTADPSTVVRTTGDTPDPATTETSGAKVSLPKISLPQYSGDPMRWNHFWD